MVGGGVVICHQCGIQRAKAGDRVCPVCWLLNTLRDEHRAGDHDTTPNPSCRRCRAEGRVEVKGFPPILGLEVHPTTKRLQLPRNRRDLLDPVPTTTDAPRGRQRRAEGRKRPPVPRETTGRIDHSACDHPRTPAARAKCRAERARA